MTALSRCATDGKPPEAKEGLIATTDGKPSHAKVGCLIECTAMWHFTYIIENSKGYQYVGLTDDLHDRLERHNRGEIPSTAKYRPWRLVNYTAFPTRDQAAAYEKYLKSGSGTTFRQKHLVPKKVPG